MSNPITKLSAAILLSCSMFLPAAASNNGVVYVDEVDCPGCNDSDLWEAAIQAATDPDTRRLGTVVGNGNREYVITEPIEIVDVHGGEINGNGASFLWSGVDTTADLCPPGGYDDEPVVPMWKLCDTTKTTIKNLSIVARPWLRELDVAIEFTNPYSVDQEAPTGNIIDHVIMYGTNTNGLHYGILFNLYCTNSTTCNDQNNDQATINDVTMHNVTKAAIRIEGAQSGDHRLINVNAYADTGVTCTDQATFGCSKFVDLVSGSFHSYGGYRNGFQQAEFLLRNPTNNVVIMNSQSEKCYRMIESTSGWSTAGKPVQVIGGRFAVDQIAPDGRVIKYERRGPLVVEGLTLSHVVASPPQAKIYFAPPQGPPGGESYLIATGNYFKLNGSDVWDPIAIGPGAKVISYGNMCAQDQGIQIPCSKGYAGGMNYTPLLAFADLTALPSPADGQWVYCTNCANGSAPCQSGGTGAIAARVGGSWSCGGGLVTLTGGQSVSNKTLVSSDLSSATNLFPRTSLVTFSAASPSTDRWCAPNGGCTGTSGESSRVQLQVPALKLSDIRCSVTSAPGNGRSWVLTVQKNGTNTGMVCTISDNVPECTDTTPGIETFVAGDRLSLFMDENGSTPTPTLLACSVSAGP